MCIRDRGEQMDVDASAIPQGVALDDNMIKQIRSKVQEKIDAVGSEMCIRDRDTAETHRQNSIKVYAVASSNITVMQNNEPVNKKTPEAYKMNILVRHRLFTRPSGYSAVSYTHLYGL